ncbi:MAG: hypothetical protein P8N01_06795 [Burkholderiales bacterium]|nr:hypothetical protein [Burkholderiales bacterium]
MKALTFILSLAFVFACSSAFAGPAGTPGPSKYSGANIKPVEDKPKETEESSEHQH